MELKITDIEAIKKHFSPKVLDGTSLPNPKSVMDGQPYFLKESDGVYVEHIMFKGRWHKKIVDSNSNVILEEV